MGLVFVPGMSEQLGQEENVAQPPAAQLLRDARHSSCCEVGQERNSEAQRLFGAGHVAIRGVHSSFPVDVERPQKHFAKDDRCQMYQCPRLSSFNQEHTHHRWITTIRDKKQTCQKFWHGILAATKSKLCNFCCNPNPTEAVKPSGCLQLGRYRGLVQRL